MQERIYELNEYIDFTLLDPRATIFDLEKLCNIAYKNQYYSVCVNPTAVAFVKGYILKNFQKSDKKSSKTFGELKIVRIFAPAIRK